MNNKNITDAGLNCPNTGYQFDANRGSKGKIAKGSDLPNDALVNGGTDGEEASHCSFCDDEVTETSFHIFAQCDMFATPGKILTWSTEKLEAQTLTKTCRHT